MTLNDTWHAKVTFFATVLLLSVLGVLIGRCIAVLTLAGFKASEAQARASIVSTSVSEGGGRGGYSFMAHYTIPIHTHS